MVKRLLPSPALVAVLLLIFFSSCSRQKDTIDIGILQWTEKVAPYQLTHQGILDSLNSRGYLAGFNVRYHYRNVEQDKARALQAAREFVDQDVDLIVALGTGSCLAAIDATRDHWIPIVYSIAGAPGATGVLTDGQGKRRRITGVSMRIPISDQFSLIQELMPDMRRLGILYCSEMAQAVATGEEAAVAAGQFGWQPITSSLERSALHLLAERIEAMSDQVDALYIPTDPILGAPENFKQIITTANKYRLPVFGVAEKFVELGALAAVHCDFYEIGRQAADPIAQVIRGVDIADISPQAPLIKRVSLNLGTAHALGLTINRSVIRQSDTIFY